LDLKYSQWSILYIELRTLLTFRGELASFKADTKGRIVLPVTAEPTLKEETSPSETSAVFTSWGDAVSKRIRWVVTCVVMFDMLRPSFVLSRKKVAAFRLIIMEWNF
jgi:hypothetical protein